MEFGVHLPLLAFRGQAFSLLRLVDYAETAEQLGFTTLCANDHLIASRPWLDSLTALASILTKTPHMTLMTTVALPAVRGPVPLAKSLAALDVLSGGHLIAGVGRGSSPQDYALARLNQCLRQAGREAERFRHALGSMFYYLTEAQRLAEELLVEVVSPTLGRSVELLRERLLIGTPAECAEKLARLQAAGVQKIFLWPIEDETSQLARFHEQVLPQLPQ